MTWEQKKKVACFQICVCSGDVALDTHFWVTRSTCDSCLWHHIFLILKRADRIFLADSCRRVKYMSFNTFSITHRKKARQQHSASLLPSAETACGNAGTEKKSLFLGLYYRLSLLYKWSLLYHETYWESLKLKLISQSLRLQRRDRKL